MEKINEKQVKPAKKRHYVNTVLLCATGAALLWYGGTVRLNERIPAFFKSTTQGIYSAVTTDVAEEGNKYLAKLGNTKNISEYEQTIAKVALYSLDKISVEQGKPIALDYLVQNSKYVKSDEAYSLINTLKPSLTDSQKTELSIETYRNIGNNDQRLQVFRSVGSDVIRNTANYIEDKAKEAGNNIKNWMKRKQ